MECGQRWSWLGRDRLERGRLYFFCESMREKKELEMKEERADKKTGSRR